MMKTYNNIFLLCVLCVTGLSAAIMLWFQPISGDLTRISAYPERWFGWNDPQQDITALINSERASGKRHILVIGDSFSEAGHWQAFLGEQYSFTFIHNSKTTLEKILSKIEKDRPDAVILETAERAIPDMYNSGSTFLTAINQCVLPESNQNARTGNIKKTEGLPAFPYTNRQILPRNGSNISEGFHTLKLWAKALISPRKRKAKTLALTQTNLFSNQKNDKILLLSKDFLLSDTADENSIHTMRCSMQKAATTLSRVGIPYVMLTIPDKTTAYQQYLASAEIRQRPALINRLHVDKLQHGIDMLPPIQEMAAAGYKDIYLPNDTHWGYKGFQLAAVLIDIELASQWPAQNPPMQDSKTHD
ncbi:MAG TPA: hypothetical protein VLB90_10775 [Pseudomonadales bacterium]|nr:hypothetical protein [Pseudomonadales bacterium]